MKTWFSVVFFFLASLLLLASALAIAQQQSPTTATTPVPQQSGGNTLNIDPVATVLAPTAAQQPLQQFHDVVWSPEITALLQDQQGRPVPFAAGCAIVEWFDETIAVGGGVTTSSTTVTLTSTTTTTTSTTTTEIPTTTNSSDTNSTSANSTSTSSPTTQTPAPPPTTSSSSNSGVTTTPSSSSSNVDDLRWLRLDSVVNATSGTGATAGTEGKLHFSKLVIRTCRDDTTRLRVRICPVIASLSSSSSSSLNSVCALNRTADWIRSHCSVAVNATLHPHPSRLRLRVFEDANTGLYSVAQNLSSATTKSEQPPLTAVGGKIFPAFAAAVLSSCGNPKLFVDVASSTLSVSITGVGIAGKTIVPVSATACLDFPGVACALLSRVTYTLANRDSSANVSLVSSSSSTFHGELDVTVKGVGTFTPRGKSNTIPVGTRIVMLSRDQVDAVRPILFDKGSDVVEKSQTFKQWQKTTQQQQQQSPSSSSSSGGQQQQQQGSSPSSSNNNAAAVNATTPPGPTPAPLSELSEADRLKLKEAPFWLRDGIPFLHAGDNAAGSLPSSSNSRLFSTTALSTQYQSEVDDTNARNLADGSYDASQAANDGGSALTSSSQNAVIRRAIATREAPGVSIPMATLQDDFVVIAAIVNVSAFVKRFPLPSMEFVADAIATAALASSSSFATSASRSSNSNSNPASSATTGGGTVAPFPNNAEFLLDSLPAGTNWHLAANHTFSLGPTWNLVESPRGMEYAATNGAYRFLPRRVFGVVEEDAAAGTTSLLYVVPFSVGGLADLSSEIEEKTAVRLMDYVLSEGYRPVKHREATTAIGPELAAKVAAEAAGTTTTTSASASSPVGGDSSAPVTPATTRAAASTATNSTSTADEIFILTVQGAPQHFSVFLRRIGSFFFIADPEIGFLSSVIASCDCTLDSGLPLDYPLSVLQLKIGDDRLAQYLWGGLLAGCGIIITVFFFTWLMGYVLTLLPALAYWLYMFSRRVESFCCCVCAGGGGRGDGSGTGHRKGTKRGPTCTDRFFSTAAMTQLVLFFSASNVQKWRARFFPHAAILVVSSLYPGVVFTSFSLLKYLQSPSDFAGWFFGAAFFPMAFPVLLFFVGQRLAPQFENSPMTREQIYSKPWWVRLVAPLGIYDIRHIDSVKWRASFEDYRGPQMRKLMLFTFFRYYICSALPGITFLPCRFRFIVPFLLLIGHCGICASMGPFNRPYNNFWAIAFSLGTMLGLTLQMWENSDRNMQRMLNIILFVTAVVSLLRIWLRLAYAYYASKDETALADGIDERNLVIEEDEEDEGFLMVGTDGELKRKKKKKKKNKDGGGGGGSDASSSSSLRRRRQRRRLGFNSDFGGEQVENNSSNNQRLLHQDDDGDDEEEEEMELQEEQHHTADELLIEIDLDALEEDEIHRSSSSDDDDYDAVEGRHDSPLGVQFPDDYVSAAAATTNNKNKNSSPSSSSSRRLFHHVAKTSAFDDEDDDQRKLNSFFGDDGGSATASSSSTTHSDAWKKLVQQQRMDKNYTDFSARRHLLDQRARAIERRAAEIQAALMPGKRGERQLEQLQQLAAQRGDYLEDDDDEAKDEDRRTIAKLKAQRQQLQSMTEAEAQEVLHDAIKAEMSKYQRPMPPPGSKIYQLSYAAQKAATNGENAVPRVGFPGSHDWKTSKQLLRLSADAAAEMGAPVSSSPFSSASGRLLSAPTKKKERERLLEQQQLYVGGTKNPRTIAAIRSTLSGGKRPEEVEFVKTDEEEARLAAEAERRWQLKEERRNGPKLAPQFRQVYARQRAAGFVPMDDDDDGFARRHHHYDDDDDLL